MPDVHIAARSGPPVTPLPALSVVRADDLLDLRFEFRNLGLRRTGGPNALVRVDPGLDAFVIVWFEAQSVGEAVFAGDPTGVARADLGGVSRLAFRMPETMTELPFTLDGLLGWTALTPSLSPTALGLHEFPSGPDTAPREPSPTVTAIEAPYRLVLSPVRNGRWAHATAPVTQAGTTELWHTRLVARRFSPDGEPADRVLRPIWTPDRRETAGDDLPTALSAANRRRIVGLAGDLSQGGNIPDPIATRTFALSARGAWLDVMGEWPIPDPPLPPFDASELHDAAARALEEAELGDVTEEDRVEIVRQTVEAAVQRASRDAQPALRREILHDLSQFPDDIGRIASELFAALPARETFAWSQRMAQGRDDAVRVTTPGFLYPWGHPVTLVEVITRELVAAGDGTFTATLVARLSLIVRDPSCDYRSKLGAYPHGGRESPFLSAWLVNAQPRAIDPASIAGGGPCWPRTLEGTDVQWAVACEDRAGRVVMLEMPLLFVPLLDADGHLFDPARAIGAYQVDPRRHVDTAGQELAFVEGTCGEGVLVVRTLSFDGVRQAGSASPAAAGFLPCISGAAVSIPSVESLLGSAGVAGGIPIEWDRTYLDSGFDAAHNAGELFARAVAAADDLDLAFVAERAGGLARPNMIVQGLSRVLGPVPDAENVLRGVLQPQSFIPDARILGGLSLRSLIAPVLSGLTPGDLGALADLDPDALWERLGQVETRLPLPALTSHTLRDEVGVPTAAETRFVWKPDLRDTPLADLPALTLNPGARLRLATTLRAPLNGSPPTFESRGELADFSFAFANVVTVTLARLEFLARGGRKLEVSASGVALHFEGPLAFIEEIRHYLPPEGFGDPPAVTVTTDGITAGYSLGLPSIGVGVFSFENVGLFASLELPFVDKPTRLRFALSERHDPFLVTVSLFGGGGFLALGVAGDGALDVEAAIEFGGNFSLDLIVASGGVHVLAGIYFKLAGPLVDLSGYLRAGGAVTVLGVITASVEFYLALTFHHSDGPQPMNVVAGDASLTVGVEVLFLHQDVTLHVHREFANPVGDPTFEDLVEPEDWASYWAAFAA